MENSRYQNERQKRRPRRWWWRRHESERLWKRETPNNNRCSSTHINSEYCILARMCDVFTVFVHSFFPSSISSLLETVALKSRAHKTRRKHKKNTHTYTKRFVCNGIFEMQLPALFCDFSLYTRRFSLIFTLVLLDTVSLCRFFLSLCFVSCMRFFSRSKCSCGVGVS